MTATYGATLSIQPDLAGMLAVALPLRRLRATLKSLSGGEASPAMACVEGTIRVGGRMGWA